MHKTFRIAMSNLFRRSNYLEPHLAQPPTAELLIVERFGDNGEFIFISDTGTRNYEYGSPAPDETNANLTIFGVLARDNNDGRATFMLYPFFPTTFFEDIHTAAKLNRLREEEVVKIAVRRGIPGASKDNRKADTIAAIIRQQDSLTNALERGLPGSNFPSHGYAILTEESYGLRIEVSGRDSARTEDGETIFVAEPKESLIEIDENCEPTGAGRATTWHFDARQVPWSRERFGACHDDCS